MSPPRFVRNKTFEAEMGRDPAFRRAMAAEAGVVRSRAEQLTVRIMPSSPQAFVVEEVAGGVFVINTDYGGHIAEWGSVNSAPVAPLRFAVRSAGLRLEERSN